MWRVCLGTVCHSLECFGCGKWALRALALGAVQSWLGSVYESQLTSREAALLLRLSVELWAAGRQTVVSSRERDRAEALVSIQ